MPRYDVRVTALTLDVPYDWLDTSLARLDLPGMTKGGRGVRRSLSDQAVLTLSIALQLTEALGVGLERAIALANALTEAPDGIVQAGPVTLRVDLPAAQAELRARLRDALERVVPIRRDRPPSTAR